MSDFDALFDRCINNYNRNIIKEENTTPTIATTTTTAKPEEYIPPGPSTSTPNYIPSKIYDNAGPKKLSIEEYIKRTTRPVEQKTHKPTRRGGKRHKIKAEQRELYNLINISKGPEKTHFIQKLKELKRRN